MYKNILVPVTFDDNCDVDTAIAAAKQLGGDDSKVTFLHVVEILPTYVEPYVPAAVFENNRDAAHASLNELAAQYPGSATALVDGSAGRSITGWAEENSADCIIISSHTPGLSDIFLGSTAAWVVRHAGCCVHVLR